MKYSSLLLIYVTPNSLLEMKEKRFSGVTVLLITQRNSSASYPHKVNGIIAVSNGVIGCEYHAPVRLYRNGNKQVPDCLRFLLEVHKLGDLLGIAQH